MGIKFGELLHQKWLAKNRFGECLQQRCVAYYYVIITCRVHVRDCMCNNEAGTRMSSFIVDSVICGHHIYKAIWEPVNGEE